MISRYSVWLNDYSLSEIDPDIYISDIAYSAISRPYNLTQIAKKHGRYSSELSFQENKIAISFEVRKYNTEDRQRVVQDVIKWASFDGWLKTSDRSGQKIYARCSRFPAVLSAMRWLDTLTIEFTAYDYPFWVSETAMQLALNNGESGQLYLPGAFDTEAEVEITAGGVLTSAEIHSGDTFIILNGLTVSADDVIKITYSADHHILSIKQGTTSILDKRTVGSSDDLIVKPGNNDISFSADGDAVCIVSCKGVYL